MMTRPWLWIAGAALVLLGGPASAKRSPPMDVPPIVDGSVRYEAPHFGSPCGQNGGCVVAYDNASNGVLWTVQVYCTRYDTSLETDVQDVFITSLAVENGQVLVANENDQHFVIDPATRQVNGDARGCDGGTSGCGVLPTPVVPWAGALGALAILLLLRRMRRSWAWQEAGSRLASRKL